MTSRNLQEGRNPAPAPEITEAQAILEMTGRGKRFSLVCAVSLALFCAGGSLAILLGNFFLAPVMAVGFSVSAVLVCEADRQPL